MDAIIKELEQRTASLLSVLSQEVAGIRGNRPSPLLLEDLKIEYFGEQVPVKQLGSISVIPPRELSIALWDPSGLQTVAKAIEDSKRGFSVSVRGNGIIISLPALSEERRTELVKLVKSITEKFRIQLRGQRDDANKKLQAAKAAKTVTEDMEARGKKRIQEITDRVNKEIEMLVEKKTKEINE